MTLLIVNDIVIEAETMASDIDWSAYGIGTVKTAFSAGSAKKTIMENPVDILLCDIEMPEESGLSLIRWIRENEFDIDCILLTCHAEFVYAKEGLSLNCQDYITLPARYEEIASSVAKACEKRVRRKDEKRLQDYGRSWLKDHADQMEERSSDENKISPKEIAEKCVQYILEHISDCDLDVPGVAGSVYLNPIYLNRIFKKEKGTSINQWIIQQRMELAATLLRNTGRPAAEIALETGYNNYPYFSTVFKKYFGVAPSQFCREKSEQEK